MGGRVLAGVIAALTFSCQTYAADTLDHEKAKGDCACSDNLMDALRHRANQRAGGNKEVFNLLMAGTQTPKVCVKGSACNIDVPVAPDGDKCVASLDYCLVCAYQMAKETITWTIKSQGGKSYGFGSPAKPASGVDIKKPQTNRAGTTRTHFENPVYSRQVFTWTVGPDVTWKHPVNLTDHGHDLIISELDAKGQLTNKQCKVIDPPIMNTVN